LADNLSGCTIVIIYNNSNSLASACQINYDLIILSVKTLHTLVFFCKFPQFFAFGENLQLPNNTTNSDNNGMLLCKKPNLIQNRLSRASIIDAIIMPK
jgi:hypothetical protein